MIGGLTSHYHAVSRIDKFICYSDTTFTLNMTNIEQQNKTICLFINCRKLQIYSLDSFKFQHSICDLRLLMFTIMQDYKWTPIYNPHYADASLYTHWQNILTFRTREINSFSSQVKLQISWNDFRQSFTISPYHWKYTMMLC